MSAVPEKKNKKPVPLFCTFPMAADKKGPDGKAAPSEESVEQEGTG